MTVEYVATRDVPLRRLTRFPGNARHGDLDQLVRSIERHGQYRSLVVRDTGTALVILAGNNTRDALARLGRTSARCEVVRCDEATARRINLADNRLAELGRWDFDALAELLSYLDDDYDGTGYRDADVERLLTPPEPTTPVEPAPPAPASAGSAVCPNCGHPLPEPANQ